MRNILIIKCGSTYPEVKEKHGDFDDWIIQQSNMPHNVFKVYDISEGDQLRHPSEYIAAFITGSHYNVNQRLPWIKQLKDWIITARYSNIPVLGICFGHQIIADALGGKVMLNPKGRTIGIDAVNLTPNGKQNEIFKNIGNSFESYLHHSYIVDSLPTEANILATNSTNIIQAFQIDKIYGVQFHVEYTPEIMKMNLELSKEKGFNKTRVQLKSSFKNQSILSNFLDETLKL
ncbi:MAG: gamma-glutamyl-gamma-aminobutyrate hydrolase family protein [Prolixibacteraceae bacterium]